MSSRSVSVGQERRLLTSVPFGVSLGVVLVTAGHGRECAPPHWYSLLSHTLSPSTTTPTRWQGWGGTRAENRRKSGGRKRIGPFFKNISHQVVQRGGPKTREKKRGIFIGRDGVLSGPPPERNLATVLHIVGGQIFLDFFFFKRRK